MDKEKKLFHCSFHRVFAINVTLLSFVIALGVVYPLPAYAYLDAGTTSMILQAVIGGIAGGAFFCKLYLKRFIRFLKRDKTSTSDGSFQQKPPEDKLL